MLKDSLLLAFIMTVLFFSVGLFLSYIVHWCWPKEKMFSLEEMANPIKPNPVGPRWRRIEYFTESERITNICFMLEAIDCFAKRDKEIERLQWGLVAKLAGEYARKEPKKVTQWSRITDTLEELKRAIKDESNV